MTDSADDDRPPEPRDAATLILVRRDGPEPRVLMGQRGRGAVFMPSKFVFPGGALDPEDADVARRVAPHVALSSRCSARLRKAHASPLADALPLALAMAAIRETFEETGLALGRPAAEATALADPAPGPDWTAFLSRGLMPAADALTFVFRAITPPARTRRFDARFFLADAGVVDGDTDDLSAASGELSHLSWLTLAEARRLELPLITEVVLAEVEELLHLTPEEITDRPAPFFNHSTDESRFEAL